MITISINGRLLDAIYALVTSMTAGAQVAQVAPETAAVETIEAPVEMPETPEAPAVGLKTVEDLRGHMRQAAAAKVTETVAAGRSRKKAAPRERVAVTRPGAPEPIKAAETLPEPIKHVETPPEPIKTAEAPVAPIKAAETVPEPIKAVETMPEPIKVDETPIAPKAHAPAALDDEWPTTLTKPSEWDYDGQGASWRAANQIGTAELGAAIQRVYVDHADIIKMPSVRVAMSKLGLEGWWRCVAKNIAEARDASNKPLDITPKGETKND